MGKTLSRWIWAATLISLPLTSFPLLTKISGSQVAPLAALPLAVILVGWIIPDLLRGKRLPVESFPLVAFFLVSLAACAGAYFIDIPSFKSKGVTGQELRALATLLVGLCFYLAFAAWPQTKERMQDTLRWLSLGGLLTILWAFVQAYFVFFRQFEYSHWALSIQNALVLASPFLNGKILRVSGLTYEPSWFAHEMVILYFPLWLSTTYHRTSAFGVRLGKISVENILLILGIAAFGLSFPRVGAISFLLSTAYLFIHLNQKWYRRLVAFIEKQVQARRTQAARFIRAGVTLGTAIAFLAGYTILAIGLVFAASRVDKRFRTLLTTPPNSAEIRNVLALDDYTIYKLASRFQFMERVVYWNEGLAVFNQHPWLGVGLGNAGFFSMDSMPAVGWSSPEVRSLLYNSSTLPNIKSFWVRLLAETGLFGFAIFVAWYVLLWRSAGLTWRARPARADPDPLLRILAFAGQLALLAFIIEGFSIDSFAMPYVWVAAGLISAAGFAGRKQDPG